MRKIICADAIRWLRGRMNCGAIVTSLPDADEVGMVEGEWIEWFMNGIELCIKAATPTAPVIFYQTDRKAEGRLRSKALLVLDAGRQMKARLLWHKVVLRTTVGKVDLYRPGFTHLIAMSMKARCGRAYPDVMERGDMVYRNAMGLNAARFAVMIAKACTNKIVDPFCGRGTVVAVADAEGMDATGVDIDAEQCAYARKLEV